MLSNAEKIEINEADKYGRSPFYAACSKGQIEVVKYLLNDERTNINQSYRLPDWTPFWCACERGHLEIVKLLLNDKRIDVKKAAKNGRTPIHITCFRGHIEILENILASGREINLNAKEKDGETAIDIARVDKLTKESEEVFQKRREMVPLLESFERNPNETRTKLRIKLGLTGKTFII